MIIVRPSRVAFWSRCFTQSSQAKYEGSELYPIDPMAACQHRPASLSHPIGIGYLHAGLCHTMLVRNSWSAMITLNWARTGFGRCVDVMMCQQARFKRYNSNTTDSGTTD